MLLFQRLNLKARLKHCFRPAKGSAIFGPHVVVLLLVVHLLLGFRRLRDVDYYRDDPVVQRLLGLRRLPDVATISRTLASLSPSNGAHVRQLSSTLVIHALQREQLPRLTLDFDGSVVSTRAHAEGTAVGYNPKRKGARSYYNLFCTVAQTGQFLDVLHRPGNVHDSKGGHEFMMDTFDRVGALGTHPVLEARLDSAFFSQHTLTLLDLYGAEYTLSVPFERFPELKHKVESRNRWRYLDKERSYFESAWKPASWAASYRFVFVRRRVKRQTKQPLQLDLFQPRQFDHDYRVVVTNKTTSAGNVVLFHGGRGAQEGVFGEAKQQAGLDLIPTRRLLANQMVTLCAMMALTPRSASTTDPTPTKQNRQPFRAGADTLRPVSPRRRLGKASHTPRRGPIVYPAGKRVTSTFPAPTPSEEDSPMRYYLMAFATLLLVIPADGAVPIPYVQEDQIELDGELDDWSDLLGPPLLTASDFRIPEGHPRDEYDPENLDFRIWLGWSPPGRIFVAATFTDDLIRDDGSPLFVQADGLVIAVTPDSREVMFTHMYAVRPAGILIQSFPAVGKRIARWSAHPPFADAVRAEQTPATWGIEFFFTSFDVLLADATSPVMRERERVRNESVITDLAAGDEVDLVLRVVDVDDHDRRNTWFNLAPEDASTAVRALLLSPGETAVLHQTWGEVKATR